MKALVLESARFLKTQAFSYEYCDIANIKNSYFAEHLQTAPSEDRILRNLLQILNLASVLLHRPYMQSLRKNVCRMSENRNRTG